MKPENRLAFLSRSTMVVLAAHVLFAGQPPPDARRLTAPATPVPALSPYIDAHTHFDEHHPDAAVQAALTALTRQNAEAIFFQTPPDTFDRGGVDAEVIQPSARKHATKLAVLGGGGSLNAMIQRSVATGEAGPDVVRTFRDRAEALLRGGAAGFGEMTAEHFDGATPYQYAPADHPLFLLLADLAAQHDVPIDLHIEAVPQSMPLPVGLRSPPNPPQLRENIAAFERLLDHNPRARIIWAHAGSDGTGYRTPALTRRLLQAHANLFVELKTDPVNPGRNYPLADGRIKPDWLSLLEDFPTRFIVGSDQHYPEPNNQPQRWQTVVLLLNQLPAALRRQIGSDNVRLIFPNTRLSRHGPPTSVAPPPPPQRGARDRSSTIPGAAGETGEWTGRVRYGVIAVGGETTGIVLTTNQGRFELLADEANRARLEALDGKEVTIRGRLQEFSGVEVPLRRVIRISEIVPR